MSATSSTLGRSILIGLCVGAAGALLNFFPVRSGFGLELFLGSIGTFVLLRIGNTASAFIAGTVASLVIWNVTGSPVLTLLVIGETGFCLWLNRWRGTHPLASSPLYWATLGLPILSLYNAFFLDEYAATVLAGAANQLVTAFANVALGALLASIILAVTPVIRSHRPRSMRVAIIEVLVAFAMMPVVIYAAFAAPDYEAAHEASVRNAVETAARTTAENVETLLAEVRDEAADMLLVPSFGPGHGIADGDGPIEIDPKVEFGNLTLPFEVDSLLLANHERKLIATISSNGMTTYSDGPQNNRELIYPSAEADGCVPLLAVELFGSEAVRVGWALVVLDAARVQSTVTPHDLSPDVQVTLSSVTCPDPVVASSLPGPAFNAIAPLTSSPWLVQASYDSEAFLQEHRERSAWFLGLMATIVSLCVAASTATSRVFARPFERVALSVAAGPVGAPVPAGVTETDTLADAVESSRAETLRYAHENRALAHRLSALLTHAPVMIYAAEKRDIGYAISYASPGLNRSLGIELEPNAAFETLHGRVHPIDRRRVDKDRERLLDGHRFQAEYRVVLPSEETIWLSEVADLVRDSAGRPFEVVGVVMDVTERKLADAQMLQSSKLINLGQMTAGLAHELKQPLNVIGMAAKNAISAIGSPQESTRTLDYVLAKLERIESQVHRSSRLVDHLRAFGRKPSGESELFDVEAAVAAALAMVETQIRMQRVTLNVCYECAGVVAVGSAERLGQVVINLALNALDAVVQSREAEPFSMSPSRSMIEVAVLYDAGPDRISIQVADNGGGIDSRVIEHIFEPFVTTKPPGAGTGLGLSLSLGIVNEMGGTITAANVDGGARFVVDLPAYAGDLPAVALEEALV